MKKRVWVAVIVLVANAFALVIVARNARGAAEAVITMTEREAPVTVASTDNSGMTLWLRWDRETPTDWFDRAKLAALGFDCSVEPNAPDAEKHYSAVAALARQAYIVLEYDPSRLPAPAAPTQTAPQAKAQSLESRPRLRPIDVGNDASALRARYSDPRRYIVTTGIVRPYWYPEDRFQLKGRVVNVLPDQLYVPREMQATIATAVGKNDQGMYSPLTGPPRYEVTIAYGRSLLPRVVGVKKLGPVTVGSRQ